MSVLEVLDLLGVFVFSGASLALTKGLDLFGVLVLGVVTALGGGVVRDLCLGREPPAALGGSRYLLVALAAVPAIVLGCLTGIGGGMVRDVLVGEVPTVLRREVYAVPAVLGAGVVCLGDGLGIAFLPTAAVAVAAVFGLRVLGLWRGWHFPVARAARPARQE